MDNFLQAKRARWASLWRELHSVRFEPLPTREEVERIWRALPSRHPDENLADWLARSKPAGSSAVVPFPKARFRALTTIERLAASSGHEAFPLPEAPMISPDETFRLRVEQAGSSLEIHVEALGSEAFEYAECCIGISGSGDLEGLIAFVYLDAFGDGHTRIDDTPEARQALARPVLGLLEAPNE
jgi:hypothetical protein